MEEIWFNSASTDFLFLIDNYLEQPVNFQTCLGVPFSHIGQGTWFCLARTMNEKLFSLFVFCFILSCLETLFCKISREIIHLCDLNLKKEDGLCGWMGRKTNWANHLLSTWLKSSITNIKKRRHMTRLYVPPHTILLARLNKAFARHINCFFASKNIPPNQLNLLPLPPPPDNVCVHAPAR